MLPTYNQGTAVQHIIALNRPLNDLKAESAMLATELTDKLRSRQIILDDLVRGDTIRVKAYPEDPNQWYRNQGLFFVEVDRVILPAFSLDDYGHVPSNFFWPEFSLDYWFETVDHNHIVPVDFKQAYDTFVAKDVQRLPLNNGKETLYIETPEFYILYSGDQQDYSKVAKDITTTKYVEVQLPTFEDHEVVSMYLEWQDEYEELRKKKPVLVGISIDSLLG